MNDMDQDLKILVLFFILQIPLFVWALYALTPLIKTPMPKKPSERFVEGKNYQDKQVFQVLDELHETNQSQADEIASLKQKIESLEEGQKEHGDKIWAIQESRKEEDFRKWKEDATRAMRGLANCYGLRLKIIEATLLPDSPVNMEELANQYDSFKDEEQWLTSFLSNNTLDE